MSPTRSYCYFFSHSTLDSNLGNAADAPSALRVMDRYRTVGTEMSLVCDILKTFIVLGMLP